MNAMTHVRGIIAAQANSNRRVISGLSRNFDPAASGDPAAVAQQITVAFQDLRSGWDERYADLQAQLADLAARSASREISGGGDFNRSATVERKAWASFVRSGDESGLAEVRASMSVGSDPDGGYTVSPVMGTAIQRTLFDASPLARLARRVSIGAGDAFEEPWDVSDIGAEWVGETQARPSLDGTKLKMLSYPVMEIYTNQVVTQRLLDDSSFDLGSWIETKISDKFARTEAAAFVHGDGVLKPRGLLTYPTAATPDATRPFGTIEHVNTGASAAFPAAPDGVDKLVDLVYALRSPYRPNARFLMNRKTAGLIRKLKDGEGRFIWQAGGAAGQPDTLLGFPIELDEEFPDIAANSLSIAFGDFAQAYITVDKPGIRMIRDPFTARPHVVIYAYRRVGGGLQNSEAVKFLRFGS